MLKIGDFSKLSRISIRMLRHYDEIGLMEPRVVDPATGYRYYGEDQLSVADPEPEIHGIWPDGYPRNLKLLRRTEGNGKVSPG